MLFFNPRKRAEGARTPLPKHDENADGGGEPKASGPPPPGGPSPTKGSPRNSPGASR